MTEITIRCDIGMNRGAARVGLVALLLAAAATELSSESVSMSTYFPASSGVYTNLSTRNTFLARDGASTVLIGTGSQPPGSRKLYVEGNADATGSIQGDVRFISDGYVYWGYAPATGGRSELNTDHGGSIELGGVDTISGPLGSVPHITFHTGNGGEAAYSTRLRLTASNRLDFITESGGGNASPVMSVINDKVAVRSGAAVMGALDVGGEGVIVVRQTGTACRTVTNLNGPPSGSCNAGEYFTMIAGRRGAQTSLVLGGADSGSYICCPCPGAICAGLP